MLHLWSLQATRARRSGLSQAPLLAQICLATPESCSPTFYRTGNGPHFAGLLHCKPPSTVRTAPLPLQLAFGGLDPFLVLKIHTLST
jgi:hypothetical protein